MVDSINRRIAEGFIYRGKTQVVLLMVPKTTITTGDKADIYLTEDVVWAVHSEHGYTIVLDGDDNTLRLVFGAAPHGWRW